MDITFHYYTIKAAAIIAGFPEEDAQTIASYSQFVDDYSNYTPMYFKDIPTFAQHLAKPQNDGGWTFHPVTTGFENIIETTRLLTPENQKNILIPFHFIPTKPLNTTVTDRREWRVKPAQLLCDSEPSLIRDLLLEAREKILTKPHPSDLIRIGILLHIYADTYAHQRFSGFHNWENNSYLTHVQDNQNNKDITRTYRPYLYYMSPSVGHANIGHAVDETNISFTIKQKTKQNKRRYSEIYRRNNTLEFLNATHDIISYLLACRNRFPLNTEEENKISKKFTPCFLTNYNTPNKLNDYWKTIFPHINFQYNKQDMYKVNNNFFFYNIIADEIRKRVNGEKILEIDFPQSI